MDLSIAVIAGNFLGLQSPPWMDFLASFGALAHHGQARGIAGHAIRLMMQHRVKRLVVVHADRRFRGLIDRREILRLLAGES